jgi:hypothetical protein
MLAVAITTPSALLAESPASSAKWLHIADPLDERNPTLEAAQIEPEREKMLFENNLGFTDLLLSVSIHIGSDGTLTERVAIVRRYLTEFGAGEHGNFTIWALPSFQTVHLERAYVVTKRGQRIALDVETIQLIDDTQPRIFSDARGVVLPLPGLGPDATAVIEYELTFRASQWPLPWARHYQLESISATERMEVTIGWDRGVAPPVWATNDDRLECSSGERRVFCEISRLDALVPDPDMTAFFDVTTELVVAEAQSWAQLAVDVREVVETKIREAPIVRPPAGVLVEAETSDERWEALYRFVADEIRYLGLEHQTSSVVPHAPAVTLERRYGDCKDKVTLFVALARAAGLEAYPVLVSSRRHDVERLLVPSANYFDHMIACRKERAENEDCVDLTMSHTSPSNSVLSLGGNTALRLHEGADSPHALARPRYGWRIEIDGETEVRCDGSIATRITRNLGGLASVTYRAILEGVSAQERQKLLKEENRNATQADHVSEFAIDGLRHSKPFIAITHRYDTPPSSPLLDSGSVTDNDSWLSYHGISFRSGNSHFPFLNPGLQLESRLHYALCEDADPGFVGPELDFDSTFGTLRREYQRGPSEVTVTSTLDIPAAAIQAKRIEDFNRFLEGALDQAGVWFAIEPARQ